MTFANHLGAIFDQDAELYDQARPRYPASLFENVTAYAGLPPQARLLEIGSGTGQATLPFARRGYRITCIEFGQNLAAAARQKLAAFPQVEVLTTSFEGWQGEAQAFDLAFSATAFHWLNPEAAYPKLAAALKPGGTLALFWNKHVHLDVSQDFFESIQPFYQDAFGKKLAEYKLPLPSEVAEPVREQLDSTSWFGPVTVLRYPWQQEYDAEGYLALLNTYSDHRSLEQPARERLFDGIARVINKQDQGKIIKGYLTLLYLARRR